MNGTGPASTIAPPPAFRLDRAQLDELAAGYGNQDAIRTLTSAQLSRRLLLVRAVADRAGDRPLRTAAGDRPSRTAAGDRSLRAAAGLDDALRLFTAARRHDSAAADIVTQHPYVAAWAHRCLRLLAGDTPVDQLRADLGHLHTIAVAAAARAGLDFTLDVPARDSTIGLPTLGTAHGLGEGPVRVTGHANGELVLDSRGARGNRVRIPIPIRSTTVAGADPAQPCPGAAAPIGADRPGWAARREIVLDPEFTLAIEDTDAYRDCYPWRPTRRLDEPEAAALADLLRHAWQIVCQDHPRHAEAMRIGLRSIVPVRGPAPGQTVSAASRWAYGSVAVSVPDDPATLALLLVHEFQHMKLGALLDLVPLHRTDGTARHFAPWRADPRPVGALLQGAYAHLGVADFWRRQRRRSTGPAARLAEFEFGYWLSQTRRATRSLAESGELTDEGRTFVDGMADTLRDFAADPGPADITAGVHELVDAASVRWRLVNLRPPAAELDRLRRRWVAGDGPVVPNAPAELTDAPAPAGPARLTALAGQLRDRLLRLPALHGPDPGGAAPGGIGPDDTGAGMAEPGGTAPERAYLAGDFAHAVSGYTSRIAHNPADDDAWVGLALAMTAANDPGATIMATKPETVRALHTTLPGSPGPARLASWLAGPAETV
ncbi:aKG-HExxH-type peptide beta-hydroxylase [Micromonospora sp. NPDC050417]|uniref:aKG-HExxH-type peptide beta-hydroxylase n=1 Tax=Micromonospora sp. NPDC050417 TaxID=3364280 RepID=UPI0037B60B95